MAVAARHRIGYVRNSVLRRNDLQDTTAPSSIPVSNTDFVFELLDRVANRAIDPIHTQATFEARHLSATNIRASISNVTVKRSNARGL
jgi:hypothetical protein